MKGFVTTIEDFWSEYLANYEYKHETSYSNMRDEWHINFKQGNLLQSFDDELPPVWTRFKKELKISVGTVSWINLRPNQIIAPHTDNFYNLRQKENTQIENCIRYLVFLEDWKFGQCVDFQDLTIRNWKRGDTWYFDSTEKHMAVNASNFDFQTCQVNTIK